MRLILLLWLLHLVSTDNPCRKGGLSAPKQITCSNILNWDKLSRPIKVKKGRPGWSSASIKNVISKVLGKIGDIFGNIFDDGPGKQNAPRAKTTTRRTTTTKRTTTRKTTTTPPRTTTTPKPPTTTTKPPTTSTTTTTTTTTPAPTTTTISAAATDGPLPIPVTIYDCLTISCVCGFITNANYVAPNCILPDGSVYSKALRKEFRILTDAERDLYMRGFLAVRNTIYNDISTAHSMVVTSPGAHGGPSFLPWHREFLKRLEIGIRTTPINGTYPFASAAIPYWDSSMDNDVMDLFNQASSKWSPLFSADLAGSVLNGYVTDGLFANFRGILGTITNRGLDGWPGLLTLFQRYDLDAVVNTHPINSVLAATAGDSSCPPLPYNTLEFIHGDVHVWTGGDMTYTGSSTNDPLFFMHHSFCDFIFEQWRLTRQTRDQRPVQWNTAPDTCYSDAHAADSVMTPFTSFVNLDGCRNEYTDNMYSYQPRPTCSASVPCPSSFFFCNAANGRCVARLKVGAPCTIVGTLDPCYKSACSSSKAGTFGTCMAATMDFPESPGPPLSSAPGAYQIPKPSKPTYAPSPQKPVSDTRKFETCFNQEPCCQFASRSDCIKPDFVVNCPASCNRCKPRTYKLADDCSNRHMLCSTYKQQGFCDDYSDWMAENCRKECNLCGKTRQQTCQGTKTTYAPTYPPAPKQPSYPPRKIPMGPGPVKPPPYVKPPVTPRPSLPMMPRPSGHFCYNQNRCCKVWAKNQGCYKNKEIMKSVCSASCSCTPIYNVHSCGNFIKQCPLYAAKGLCWLEFMKENCRRSCRSCLSPKDEQKCTLSPPY